MQKLLGHRNVLATQIYVNLEQALFRDANDKYHVKVAETVEKAIKLIVVGTSTFLRWATSKSTGSVNDMEKGVHLLNHRIIYKNTLLVAKSPAHNPLFFLFIVNSFS
jgi:hypothetical protein